MEEVRPSGPEVEEDNIIITPKETRHMYQKGINEVIC
jgi:hypothetical protein